MRSPRSWPAPATRSRGPRPDRWGRSRATTIRSGDNPPGSKPVVDEMIEKLEDYSAEVIVAPKDAAILDAIDELLGEARSVVVPAGLPEDYKKAAARNNRTVVEDSREKAIATLDLNEIDAVLTCSRVASRSRDDRPRRRAGPGPPGQSRWFRTSTSWFWSARRSCRRYRRPSTSWESTPRAR